MSTARPASVPAVPSARAVVWRRRAAALPAVAFAVAALLLVGIQAYFSVGIMRSYGPLGARDARPFVLAYGLVVVAVAVLALAVPRRLLWLPLAVGGLATATALVAVATSGGEAPSLALALLTLTAAWTLGRAALGLPRLAADGLREAPLVALVGGLGLLGLAIFLLGILGLLRWWTVGIATVALGFFGLWRLLGPRARSGGRLVESLTATRLRAAAAGILGLQGAFAVLWAGAPDVQFDALQYKIWLPAHFAYTGRIDAQTFIDHPTSTYLGLAQLVAVPGHTAGAPGVGRYLQLFAAAVVVAAVWRLGDRVGPAIGPLAALVVGLTPHLVWQASTAYDDLFLALLVLGAALSVLHFERRPVQRPVAASAVVGFVAAGCLTGKIHLVPFVVALPAAWVIVSGSWRDAFRRAAGVLAGAAAGAAPLLVYRWIETGNPIFPYFNQVFASHLFRTSNALTSTTGRAGASLATFITFPWQMLRAQPPGIEFVAAGVFGLLVAALVVALLLGWRGPAARRAVWGAFAFSIVWWWIQFRYLRFLFPYAILAVVLVLPGLAPLEGLLRRRLAVAAIVAVAGVAAVGFFISDIGSFWNVPGRVPLSAAVGTESERAYERAAIPDAAVIQFLNRRAEKGAAVAGEIFARSLLRPDIELDLEADVADRAATFASGLPSDPAQMKELLQRFGIRWVALRDNRRALDERTGMFAPVLAKYGEIADAEQGRDLYRIVDKPAAPRPVPLCDEVFLEPRCWFGVVATGYIPFNDTPGLQYDEVHGQPVGQMVPACPGATYALTVTTGPGEDPSRAYLVFGPDDPERVRRFLDVLPGHTSVLYGTAPAGTTSVSLVIVPLGPTSDVEKVSLATAGASQPAGPCP